MDQEVINEHDFIASFLAEDHSDTTTEPEPESDDNDSPDPADSDDTDSEAPAESDSEETSEEETDEPAVKFDVKALTKAIEAEDPKAFIAALGKRADTLLGAKAHKALRKAARELKQQEARADKVLAMLNDKFGDPVTARKAAEAGDADTFVDALERQFGAGWTEIVKFVNDSLAGKPARLQAKAQRAQQQQAAQAEAAAKVKATIETTVKASDAKLLKAHPKIVDLVFAKMQAEYRNGVTTPAKAFSLVKKELQEQYQALSKVFGDKSSTETRTNKPRPPREERQSEGRPKTEQEFIEEFLREHGSDNRFRKGTR